MGVRTPRTGLRIRAQAPPARWATVALLAVLALLPLVLAGRAVADGWEATGDVALIGLQSRDAWTRDAPLVGHPTTADRFTGTASNNPGPAQYWIGGVTIFAFGDQLGLVLGAALVNGAALVGIAWLAFRRGGADLLAIVTLATVGLVATLGPSSLWDPFNSEVATYPLLLAVLAAWSVAVGDLRVLPVLVAAASIAAQVHVAAAAFVAPLLVAVGTSLVVVGRRHPKAVRREGRHLGAAAAILVVAWAPVVLHELSSRPSNVVALWRTATVDRPRIGLAFVAERVLGAVAPLPAFVRSQEFLADVAPWRALLAALVVGGTGSLALHLRRTQPGSSLPWLVALVGSAMLTSAWVSSRQPPLSAFRADGARWLWIVSVGVWVAAAWGVRSALPARARDDDPGPSRPPVALGVALVAVLALAATSIASTGLEGVRDRNLMPAVDEVARTTSEALPPGRYHLAMEGDQALLTFGPALAYRLEGDGFAIQVDDNAFGRAFGTHRMADRGDTPRIRVSSSADATAGDDERLVAQVPQDAARTESLISVFTTR